MESKVLVTYATSNGSTEEVAQTVAQVLLDEGVAAETHAIRDVDSLEQYSAVVLGAPLYIGRMHKDARRFLAAHRTALTKMPVALFVLGPVQKEEKDWKGARTQLNGELAKFAWFTPVSQEILGGRFDPAKLRFPFNLIPVLRKMPAQDVRDWTAIRHWAMDLASILSPVVHR